jgi:hypothetical protein|tara:strand:+ start:1010 stop:1378 length:369 start_codon:yes stop_codon:yes gene_type:complete
MKALALLRTLAEFQQYPQLQQTAQQCWDDSQAPAILPLLALAYAYLGDMTQANAYYEQAQAHKASLDGDSLRSDISFHPWSSLPSVSSQFSIVFDKSGPAPVPLKSLFAMATLPLIRIELPR